MLLAINGTWRFGVAMLLEFHPGLELYICGYVTLHTMSSDVAQDKDMKEEVATGNRLISEEQTALHRLPYSIVHNRSRLASSLTLPGSG